MGEEGREEVCEEEERRYVRRYMSDTIIVHEDRTLFLLSHACIVKVGTFTLVFLRGGRVPIYIRTTR